MDGTSDIIVVGAGPVGLSLALALARAGRKVRVLEKEEGTAERSRAPAIWPRTQEIFADLGVLDRMLAEGMREPVVTLFDVDRGQVLLRLPIEELVRETRHPWLLILPQAATERILCDAVRASGKVDLRFGREVVGFEDSAGARRVRCLGPQGLEYYASRFLIGCDGAHSTVRETLGLRFEGTTYANRAALADIVLDGPSEKLRFPRLSTRDGLAIGIRIDPTTWRLILPFRPGDDVPLEIRVAEAVTGLFPNGTSYDLVWQSEFRLHRRISSQLVHGRVALAGDAAHLNSPVGGQGMNAGVQDAAALSAALDAALNGDGQALQRYERNRKREIGEGVNIFTDRLTRALLIDRGRWIRPLLRTANLLLRLPPLRRRFLRRLAMLRNHAK